MRRELERFEMFAYDALQNDGWDDIEVNYYHDDRYPHEVYGVPITLIKKDINEDGEVYAKYKLYIYAAFVIETMMKYIVLNWQSIIELMCMRRKT